MKKKEIKSRQHDWKAPPGQKPNRSPFSSHGSSPSLKQLLIRDKMHIIPRKDKTQRVSSMVVMVSPANTIPDP